MPLEIWSPPINGFYIGPVYIYFYSLCILTAIVMATVWGRKRFAAAGGNPDQFDMIIMVSVVAGIIGARVYHVITDNELYFGPGKNPWEAFNLRNGGLGIWGAVLFGGLAAWYMCRRYQISIGALADLIAPLLLFGQAIGRLGNWFNQELFGRPTDLPWGLAIDPAHRPAGYEQYATFHPTFLYELLWCTLGGILLLYFGRKLYLGRGKTFTCYVIWYTFGRFFIEALRIDPANHIGGFRINNYVSVVVFVSAVLVLLWQLKKRPGIELWPFGFCMVQGHLVPAEHLVEKRSEKQLDDEPENVGGVG